MMSAIRAGFLARNKTARPFRGHHHAKTCATCSTRPSANAAEADLSGPRAFWAPAARAPAGTPAWRLRASCTIGHRPQHLHPVARPPGSGGCPAPQGRCPGAPRDSSTARTDTLARRQRLQRQRHVVERAQPRPRHQHHRQAEGLDQVHHVALRVHRDEQPPCPLHHHRPRAAAAPRPRASRPSPAPVPAARAAMPGASGARKRWGQTASTGSVLPAASRIASASAGAVRDAQPLS